MGKVARQKGDCASRRQERESQEQVRVKGEAGPLSLTGRWADTAMTSGFGRSGVSACSESKASRNQGKRERRELGGACM
jgi:hypothetical protein